MMRLRAFVRITAPKKTIAHCSLPVRYCLFAIACCLFCLAASFAFAGESVELKVSGVDGDVLKNVRAALTVPPGLVKDGKVDVLWLDHFQEQIPRKIQEALESLGYYNAVATVSREITPEGIFRVIVTVAAGEPVRVRRVAVRIEGPGEGNAAFRNAIEKFPLKKGDILRHDVYEEAKRGIHDLGIGMGYLNGRFSVHDIQVLVSQSGADIELVYVTGPQYFFGPINFSGAPGYPKRFLNRHVAFKEGDVFSYEKIWQTQRNLTLADRYSDVPIETDKEKAREDRVPVEIKLTPLPEKQVKIGGGYGTDTGPRFSVNYRDKNVFNAGHQWDTGVNVSKVLQGVAMGYTVPGADIRTYSALKVNLKQENTDTYTTKELSMELQHVRPYFFDKAGAIFLQMLREDSDAGDQKTNTFSLMPGFRVFDRQYDHPVRPTKGFSYLAEVRGTNQTLGSYTGFIQGTLAGSGLYPLGWEFSLLTRINAGATLQNEGSKDLPIAIRYFAGGDNSVRGYAYQSLGAKDDKGNVVGGKNTLVGSVEVERRIWNDWGAAAFYDAGNAFNSFREMDLAQGAGLGCRYYTPVGPIKLDIARQIGTPEPSFRLHLGFGFTL
ncbi:MAG: BamA/TamA family outer membrane protein [Syntrophales bacterium]